MYFDGDGDVFFSGLGKHKACVNHKVQEEIVFNYEKFVFLNSHFSCNK